MLLDAKLSSINMHFHFFNIHLSHHHHRSSMSVQEWWFSIWFRHLYN